MRIAHERHIRGDLTRKIPRRVRWAVTGVLAMGQKTGNEPY
jgi:hypothetical protein